MEMNPLEWVAVVLVVIRGLNWGLYGVFGTDLVNIITGSFAPLDTIVYALIAVSAIYLVWFALLKNINK